MKFYALLRRRLEKEPSAAVEKELWHKLDREFETLRGRRLDSSEAFRWSFQSLFRWVPIAAAAALLISFGVQVERLNTNLSGERGSETALAEIMDRGMIGEMDQEFEFYEGMEDWMFSASDEDWSELLEAES